MKSSKIQETIHITQNLAQNTTQKGVHVAAPVSSTVPHDSVSFTGAGSKAAGKGWSFFQRLSEEMADVTEITNALIAAIGTGIIAPIVILGSPGKGDKEDKDKKFLQAIRQPLSAILQLSFQVPATLAITNAINKYAYEGGHFKDEDLGTLIPDKKYLSKQVTNQEIQELAKDFDAPDSALRQELESKIKEKNTNISDSDLAKRVQKEKEKFLRDKIASKKHDALLDAKVKELQASGKKFDIKDLDLVTQKYKDAVLEIESNAAEYAKKEANAGLSWFDKFARTMGFDTKKVKALKAEQEAFLKEEGLKLLKEDLGDMIADQTVRLRKHVENLEVTSQKYFGNKKFGLSLLVNLFMVSASCYALNWVHPRFNELINKIKNKNADGQSPDNKKVEVKA